MKKLESIYILLAALFIVSLLGSCQKDPEVGGTAVQNLSGEWWVQVRDNEGNFTDDFGEDYYNFSTFNTASNSSTEMWIDDLTPFWDIKGKVNVDVNARTFSAKDSIQNIKYDSRFAIKNGKVLPNVSKGPVSKAVTDSIYFEVSLADYYNADDEREPDKVFVLSGYRRTRYAEDDH